MRKLRLISRIIGAFVGFGGIVLKYNTLGVIIACVVSVVISECICDVVQKKNK